MAKNLANKLRTGAMVGLAGLALGATAPKANAGIIYNSGYQSVTNVVADGKLILDYYQTIEEVDTDGNGSLDSYLSTFNAYNRSQGGSPDEKSFYIFNIGADLANRGATGTTNLLAGLGNVWHYESKPADNSQFRLDQNGIAMQPAGYTDNFYYTIPTNQVLGWETVNAQMGANDGAVSFGFQAPKAVPEPLTAGLLASGALVTLAVRRIRENAKRR
jgi:hypothetical protein